MSQQYPKSASAALPSPLLPQADFWSLSAPPQQFHKAHPCQGRSYLPTKPIAANEYQANVKEKSEDIANKHKLDHDNYDELEIYYADEYVDDVFVGFIGIESTYVNCDKIFPSKTILHRHLKICTHFRHIIPVPNASLAPIQVVETTTQVVGFGTGFGFRGWSYAIVSVCFNMIAGLTDSNLDFRSCINTGIGVTLIDKF